MAITYSFPGPTLVTSTTDARKDLGGLIHRNSGGTFRAGILPRSTGNLVTSRADMGVNVAQFNAALVQNGGPVFICNDGTATVTLAVAPPSNSRIDVIYVKQNESASPGTDADNLPYLAAITGTASASPVKPAIPSGALELATVTIPAGVVATNAGGVLIAQTAPFTTATGGVLTVRTQAELNALTNMPPGQQVFVMADNTSWVQSGASWLQLATVWTPPYQSGTVAVAASGLTTVNFSPAFAKVPNVIAYPWISGSVAFAYTSAAPTTASFTVRIYTAGGAQVAGTVMWAAFPNP